MSTRVEKSAAKFKPILKVKSRPSVPPEIREKQLTAAAEPLPMSNVPLPQSTLESPLTMQPDKVYSQPAASSQTISDEVNVQPPCPAGTPNSVGGMRSQSHGIQIVPTRTSQLSPSRKTLVQPSHTQSMSFSNTQNFASSSSSSSSTTTTITTGGSNTQSNVHIETDVSQNSSNIQTSGGRRSLSTQPGAKKKPPKRSSKNASLNVSDNLEGNLNDSDNVQKKTRVSRTRNVTEPADNGDEVGEAEGSQCPRPCAKRRRIESEHGNENDPENGNTAGTTMLERKRRRKDDSSTQGTPEPIDPTKITMSFLCDDPGSGRTSSRWESSKVLYVEAKRRAREERDRFIAETEAEERETGRPGGRRTFRSSNAKRHLKDEPKNTDNNNAAEKADDFSYEESLKASHYAPQVRIANGEVVLDVDSLQVDRAADPDIIEEYSHIEETDQSKFTNSNSWSTRPTVRWTKEDTALFYDALRQFGQNFDLIARVIPGRTYRMCKNKFKAEDKKNPVLIDDALRNRVSVDLATLARMTGKDFSGPVPVIEARKAATLAEEVPAQEQEQNPEASELAQAEASIEQPEQVADDNARRSLSPPSPEALVHSPSRQTENASQSTSALNRASSRVPIVLSSSRNQPYTSSNQATIMPSSNAEKKVPDKRGKVLEDDVEITGQIDDGVS